jgi:signal transduction histidine kinase/ActR/RegA family two-component response regulator
MSDTPDSPDLSWQALPLAARVYVSVVIVAGAALAVTFLPERIDRPGLFGIMLALAFLSSTWKVNLPLALTNGATLSVSYAADLMSLLLLGPRAAMVIAMAGAWAQCAMVPKKAYPLYRTLFSVAMLAITMRAVAFVYVALHGGSPASPLADLTKPLIGMIATYFMVNSVLIALAIALATRQPMWTVWRDNCLWSAPSFMVAGGAGALAAIVVARGDYWLAPLMAAPVYLTYRTYRVFLGRIEDSRRHTEELRRMHRETLEALTQGQRAERALEDERTRASKLESLGLLAGGIAHDFNNILTAILGNVSLARALTTTSSDVQAALGEAEHACVRARQLTQQLLTFSKGGRPVKKALRLQRVVMESLTLALSGSHVGWTPRIDPGLWPINADEGQLTQVFNNILINAQQAMPHGGRLVISGDNVIEPEDRWVFGTRVSAGRYVRISVKDEGLGIPAEVLGKIFEPYFSTKPTGSGLGLATSQSIVKNHGGHIDVESQPGRGTTVHVYLPASLSEKVEEVLTPLEPKRRGGGRVLVLDDEEPIRTLSTHLLRLLGYDAETVSTGEAAISRFRRARDQGRPFDVVMLDLTIPGGMGGGQVIRALIDIDPNVNAIVVSGYASDALLSRYREHGFKAAVTKPFTVDELSAALQDMSLQDMSQRLN